MGFVPAPGAPDTPWSMHSLHRSSGSTRSAANAPYQDSRSSPTINRMLSSRIRATTRLVKQGLHPHTVRGCVRHMHTVVGLLRALHSLAAISSLLCLQSVHIYVFHSCLFQSVADTRSDLAISGVSSGLPDRSL